MSELHPAILISMLLMLAFSAFFSASETAISSINKIRIQNRAQEGDRKAAAALDDGQLQGWKGALDRRAAERYGGGPQLVRTQGSGKDDEDYLI